MNFDITFCNGGIDYGIVTGNEKIVFIKSGKGGTYRGGEDKYLRMADRIHSAKGYSVICASNPMEFDTSYNTDKNTVEQYIADRGFKDTELYLIGSSNGGYQNLFLGNKLKGVKKMICINMPLMMNFHKITKELSEMDDIEKIFIYGTRDPSYKYIPFLEIKQYPLCNILTAEGADHNFRGMIDGFVSYADMI